MSGTQMYRFEAANGKWYEASMNWYTDGKTFWDFEGSRLTLDEMIQEGYLKEVDDEA